MEATALAETRAGELRRRTDDHPLIIGGYALAIARALESRGIDSRAVFHAAGVPLGLTNDPLDRVSGYQAGALMRAGVRATGDPYFGLSVADFLQASHFHAVGYALLASNTLREFCHTLARHCGLVTQSADLWVEEGVHETTLRLTHRVYTRGEHEDFFWAFVLRFMRMVYRQSLAPVRIGFHRSCPPEGPQPYEVFFGVMPAFEQAAMTMVFSNADMDATLTGACPELVQVHSRIAAEYLAKIDHADCRARVRARIIELLPSGECTRTRVARDLCVSEATLQLKLRQRGTTFQDMVDEIRRELALDYIAQRRLSITEITYLTGFGDTSNFSRAFKRWTGESPSAYRARMSA